VGFRVVSSEEDDVRKQFRVIEELPQPGHFYSVKDGPALAAALGRALRPSLRVSVETVGNEPVRSLQVGRPGLGPVDLFSKPGLEPGGYKLVAQLGRRVERDLVVNRGDALLVRLGLKDGAPVVERMLANDGLYPRKPGDDGSWFLSSIRNGLGGAKLDRIELWTTLERAVSSQETALEMVRPHEAWFEVSPAPDAAPVAFSQRWSSRSGFPAPFWGVRVAGWPPVKGSTRHARPLLTGWWEADLDSPYTTAEVTVVKDGFLARQVNAGDLQSVVIENVGVENHRVQTGDNAAGDAVFERRSCLVVRLSVPSGQRVWIRPLGLRFDGAEHRFYTAANRYTGLFWTVTRDQAELKLRTIALVSLTDFQKRAAARGNRVQLTDLPAPDASDSGPGLVPADTPGLDTAVPLQEALPATRPTP
jgi:hypothetical protein